MTTLRMLAAVLLLPTLILTALATIIGAILLRRHRRQAISTADIHCRPHRGARAAETCT